MNEAQKVLNTLLVVPANQTKVLQAQAQADISAQVLAECKQALQVVEDEHTARLKAVFAARCTYLADLLEEIAKRDPAYRLGSLIGDTPFTIDVNPERLSFGITIKATGEQIHKFDNVESFLLELLK